MHQKIRKNDKLEMRTADRPANEMVTNGFECFTWRMDQYVKAAIGRNIVIIFLSFLVASFLS